MCTSATELETHIPRNGHTLWPSECDDYAAVCDNAAAEEEEEDYAFCKVCDDSFSVAHCGGNVVSHASRSSPRHQSRTHRGIEQTVTTNSSVRQFFAAPSKTANSKAVSVTRADVMLCD